MKALSLSALAALLTIIRKLTTGRDNHTPDIIRIGGILLGAQFLVLGGVNYDKFDPMTYGGGAAALLAAIGAALRLKAPDEPEAP